MNRTAFALLLVVALAHGCYQFCADAGLLGVSNAQWWFYIFRGVEGAAIFGLCAWRWREEPGMLLVCGWALLEELQTAGCGYVAAASALGPLPAGQSLCGTLTGLPPYTLPLVLAVLLLNLRRRR
jgi:hypothetical protein